jgi:galactonate dehydratase
MTTNQDIIGYGEGVDAIQGTYHLVKGWGNRLKGRSPYLKNSGKVVFLEERRLVCI